ncbi:MAG: hypothetical protein KDK60_03570 [Chlamydiia bacterium]|nr:hypothetical protein [Chlamydiia bacterium]
MFIFLIIFFVIATPHLFNSDGTLEAHRIVLKGERGTPNIILQGDDQHTLMTFHDAEGNVRLQMQGGTFPALIMKNEEQEIVGTFFPLKDGGAAVGLGDREGNMATFIRGGMSPMLSFFHQSAEPNLAMGIGKELPHIVMVPRDGSGGLLIHGNTPPSLLFVNEKGEIPVTLSAQGLQQQGPQNSEETP